MRTTSSRSIASLIVAAMLAATLTVVLAVPAGARVAQKNTKFCEILYGDQGTGIDFEGLGPDEAAFAATLVRKLAKTGVPSRLKKDLNKLARVVYDPIADGQSASEVVPSQLAFAQKALTRFSKYVQKNCSPPVPST